MDVLDADRSGVGKAESRPLLFRFEGERALSVSVPLKKAILAVGDLLILNVALLLALALRELEIPDTDKLIHHLLIFNFLHLSWFLIFYSVGLYDIQFFSLPKAVETKVIQGVGIAGVLTIVLFYTFPFVKLQPKTVLIMDLVVSGFLLLAFRKAFVRYNHNGSKAKILLCGRRSELAQLQQMLGGSGHLGYEISRPLLVMDDHYDTSPEAIMLERLAHDEIDIVAITKSLSDDARMQSVCYRLLCAGVPVSEFSRLSEEFTGKIPISVINEGWFIANLREFDRLGFEIFKRGLDIAATISLGTMGLLMAPLVALTIKLETPGPVLFRQNRVGKGGVVFSLIKFRTMREDAEKAGPQWARESDTRITRFGRFLRRTRIDELPQLWNILKGEMSLVGPRPERPEFVRTLSATVPFYDARHLVKPGLTGWAQINFGYGSSVEDAVEKLQHDLYYIKNRSVPLELSVLLKTVGTILRYGGR
jgi:exopolysaccharide biosynthesis polyprenyl glycosylphosphotransferase